MADIVWSKKQLEIIEEHREENLLVSAAAGSGKTTVLTERIAQLVNEGTPLESMLIMTFTNAAANQMKKAIIKRTKVSPFTKFNISTFDKFYIDIYRNYYHIIGEPPGLKVVDENKNAIMKNQAINELFDSLLEAGDEEFKDFLARYCSSKDNRAAASMVLGLHNFVQNMPYPQEWLDKLESGDFLVKEELHKLAVNRAVQKLKDLIHIFDWLSEVYTKPDEGGKPRLASLEKDNLQDKAELEMILEALRSGTDPKIVSARLAEFSFARAKASRDEKDCWDSIKKSLEPIRGTMRKERLDSAKEYLDWVAADLFDREKEEMLPQIRTLSRLVREFDKIHTKKKRKAGLMDFSDTSHFALRILKNQEICEEYRKRFAYIFVDEYQDSNYIQEALIDCIKRDNNVFMVGDIKQGIYEWRFADTDIFLSRYKNYKSGEDKKSAVVDLNQNYRSKRPVIEIVNSIFERNITEETMNMRYDDDAKLHEGDKPYRGRLEYAPQLYVISTKDDIKEGCEDAKEGVEDAKKDGDAAQKGDDAGELIKKIKDVELEALNAAEVIKKYYGLPIPCSEKDKESGEYVWKERPLQYKDMAILLRSVSKNAFEDEGAGEIFYRVLMEKGIPVYLERNEGFLNTPEVQVFLNLLRIIDNPKNDIPLISVMYFPSFGFTAEELSMIRIFTKERRYELYYYDALCIFADATNEELKKVFDECEMEAAERLREKAKAFIERLSSWRLLASVTSLSDFMQAVLSQSGIENFATALPGGAQRIANLRTMADKAESFETESAAGISDFVAYIDSFKNRTRPIEIGQASLLSAEADVVRIMTIHKSKGLEWPFVMVCRTDKGVDSQRTPSYVFHQDYGVCLQLADPVRGIKTTPTSLRLVSLLGGDSAYAENIRVLYVAATRAKDILIFSGCEGDAEGLFSSEKYSPPRPDSFLNMIKDSFDREDVHIIKASSLLKDEDEVAKDSKLKKEIQSGFIIDESKLPISNDEISDILRFEPKSSGVLKKKYSVSELAEEKRRESGDAEEGNTKRWRRASSGSKSDAKPGALSAAEKGNAYHSVMEHIPFTSEGKSAEEIASFIDELKNKNIISAAEAECVEPERIAAFFASEIGKRACASDLVCKEAPFVMRHERNGAEVLVQGVIDCYFKEGDNLVLVDYKSNFAGESRAEAEKQRLLEHYAPQLELYKEALEGISGEHVKESYLYLFSLNDYAKI